MRHGSFTDALFLACAFLPGLPGFVQLLQTFLFPLFFQPAAVQGVLRHLLAATPAEQPSGLAFFLAGNNGRKPAAARAPQFFKVFHHVLDLPGAHLFDLRHAAERGHSLVDVQVEFVELLINVCAHWRVLENWHSMVPGHLAQYTAGPQKTCYLCITDISCIGCIRDITSATIGFRSGAIAPDLSPSARIPSRRSKL